MSWLRGKKTIIVQVGAVMTALGAYLSGAMELQEMLKILWAAFTVIYGAMKINRMSNGGG